MGCSSTKLPRPAAFTADSKQPNPRRPTPGPPPALPAPASGAASPRLPSANAQPSFTLERVVSAALLIQRWYRRYRAKLEARRKYTWKIFESIEYSGEQDHLKIYEFFSSILNSTKENDGALYQLFKNQSDRMFWGSGASFRSGDSIGSLGLAAVDASRVTVPADGPNVESSYRGPHLTFPLTREQIYQVMTAFRTKQVLHAKYVFDVLTHAKRVLAAQPNIVYCSTQISREFTVVGDIHGQLDDLLLIFHKNGLPSSENPYIINGDFVDRGASSVEVAVILFAFCTLPNTVYINRGNHEDHILNLRYGFVREISRKYKQYATLLISAFSDVFAQLPLATVIDNEIFICHGGVSDSTSFDMIDRLVRSDYVSVLKTPSFVVVPESFTLEQLFFEEFGDTFLWKQLVDLLWSDPWTKGGSIPNRRRGGGCYFGADVTTRFLVRNNLKLLIRSHECKPEGYEYCHNNQVLTVFSASNYYSTGSNKGAFVKVRRNVSIEVFQFMYSKRSAMKLSLRDRVGLFEQTAIRELKHKLFENKDELLEHFRRHDPGRARSISVALWVGAVNAVLNMATIPWLHLRSKLVQTDPRNNEHVLYETTFDNILITTASSENTVTKTLYRHKDTLETLFRFFDRDHSGKVSMEEFTECCGMLFHLLNKPTGDEQLKEIARTIDFNKDGMIDFNEFLEAFRLVEVGHEGL